MHQKTLPTTKKDVVLSVITLCSNLVHLGDLKLSKSQ